LLLLDKNWQRRKIESGCECARYNLRARIILNARKIKTVNWDFRRALFASFSAFSGFFIGRARENARHARRRSGR
jgi:hypothetical protein